MFSMAAMTVLTEVSCRRKAETFLRLSKQMLAIESVTLLIRGVWDLLLRTKTGTT